MLNSSHLIVPKDFKPTSNSNCSLLLWNLVKSTAATTSTTMDDKNNNFMTSGDLGLGPSAADFCIDITRTSNEYRTAFFVNIVCIALPICIFYFMCARELQQNVKSFEARCFRGLASTDDSLAVTLLRVLLWAFFIPASIICAPFFVLFVAAKQVYYKFQHRRAKRKNKFRNQLQKTEYLWGISRTAEAALESCGQLILQIWLLSSDFNSLSKDDFGTLVDKTYNGVIFFLSFSIKEATDIEKSLGKIFMSLIALVCGVAASYRTLKRGSVKMSNTAFIYLSLSFQVRSHYIYLFLFGLDGHLNGFERAVISGERVPNDALLEGPVAGGGGGLGDVDPGELGHEAVVVPPPAVQHLGAVALLVVVVVPVLGGETHTIVVGEVVLDGLVAAAETSHVQAIHGPWASQLERLKMDSLCLVFVEGLKDDFELLWFILRHLVDLLQAQPKFFSC